MKSLVVSCRISIEALASAIKALRCEGLIPFSPSIAARMAIERYSSVMLHAGIYDPPASEAECLQIINNTRQQTIDLRVNPAAVKLVSQASEIAQLISESLEAKGGELDD